MDAALPAQCAVEAVEAECGRPEQRAQFTAGGTAHQIHLEHPLAGMQETQGGRGIQIVGGVNARDAITIDADVHGGGQAGDFCIDRGSRQRAPDHQADAHHRDQCCACKREA